MRRLLERLRRDLEEFIEQRDDLLLLVGCTTNDAAFALRLLRDVEQTNASDVFLFFTHNFVEPGPFIDVTVERLKQEHGMACRQLADEGRDPLPPLPQGLFDQTRPPVDRLRESITFARALLPQEGGHRLVWAMFPSEVANSDAYFRLVSSLTASKSEKPWMHGLRLIFRHPPDASSQATETTKAPRVRTMSVNLGPQVLEASMREEVEDESLPLEQRMQALVIVATQDYAYGRTDDAIAKYNHALSYYQQTKNDTMQAFVINGIGDVFHHRKIDLEKAQHWYECAVPPAVESQAPVVMATVVQNLGDVAYKRKQFAEAEQYYDGLDKLAARMLAPETKVRALEWRGLSQEQQKAYDRAQESWEGAATLCRNTDLPAPLLREILNHLVRLYKQLRLNDKRAEMEAELKKLKS